MTQIKHYELGELADVTKLAGFEFTKYIKYNNYGEIIALRALNLRHGELDLTDIKRIDRSVSELLPRSKLYINDILLTYTGNGYGDCAIIEENDKYHLAPNICKIAPNVEKVVPYYLYSYIRTNEFYKIMSSHMTGSSQPTIPMKTIRVLPIPLPPIVVQEKIAEVAYCINEKIRKNNAINKNLIQQSQALYSTWFEQFLPFDGTMPSDWRIGTLGDIATIKTNSFNPQKNPGVMLEHYSIPAYDEQHFPLFESSDNVKSNKYILTDNSVLVSKLNPDTKRIWRPMCLTDQAVCSTEFIVFEANNSAYRDFLFSIIDSQIFSDWMCAHTTGSTNSRQRTTPSTTLEFKVNVAPDDVIDEFCASVTPMYDLISQNLLENQRLASLRDSLLPKLMSGEIDVSNIEL